MSRYNKKPEAELSNLFQLTEIEMYADKLERELERTISTHHLVYKVEKQTLKQGLIFAEEVDVQFPVASGILVRKQALKRHEEVSDTKIDNDEETH